MTTTKKTKHERRDYISKLIKERTIRTQQDLLTLLNNDGFKCSLPTLKKDLQELTIKYSSTTNRYHFESDIAKNLAFTGFNLNENLLEALKVCKIGTNGSYKLYPPITFAFQKTHNLFLHAVMITCPLNYEDLLYHSISTNLSSYDILTTQVNKGSLFFIFESHDSNDFSKANTFYNHLKSYLYY